MFGTKVLVRLVLIFIKNRFASETTRVNDTGEGYNGKISRKHIDNDRKAMYTNAIPSSSNYSLKLDSYLALSNKPNETDFKDVNFLKRKKLTHQRRYNKLEEIQPAISINKYNEKGPIQSQKVYAVNRKYYIIGYSNNFYINDNATIHPLNFSTRFIREKNEGNKISKCIKLASNCVETNSFDTSKNIAPIEKDVTLSKIKCFDIIPKDEENIKLIATLHENYNIMHENGIGSDFHTNLPQIELNPIEKNEIPLQEQIFNESDESMHLQQEMPDLNQNRVCRNKLNKYANIFKSIMFGISKLAKYKQVNLDSDSTDYILYLKHNFWILRNTFHRFILEEFGLRLLYDDHNRLHALNISKIRVNKTYTREIFIKKHPILSKLYMIFQNTEFNSSIIEYEQFIFFSITKIQFTIRQQLKSDYGNIVFNKLQIMAINGLIKFISKDREGLIFLCAMSIGKISDMEYNIKFTDQNCRHESFDFINYKYETMSFAKFLHENHEQLHESDTDRMLDIFRKNSSSKKIDIDQKNIKIILRKIYFDFKKIIEEKTYIRWPDNYSFRLYKIESDQYINELNKKDEPFLYKETQHDDDSLVTITTTNSFEYTDKHINKYKKVKNRIRNFLRKNSQRLDKHSNLDVNAHSVSNTGIHNIDKGTSDFCINSKKLNLATLQGNFFNSDFYKINYTNEMIFKAATYDFCQIEALIHDYATELNKTKCDDDIKPVILYYNLENLLIKVKLAKHTKAFKICTNRSKFINEKAITLLIDLLQKESLQSKKLKEQNSKIMNIFDQLIKNRSIDDHIFSIKFRDNNEGHRALIKMLDKLYKEYKTMLLDLDDNVHDLEYLEHSIISKIYLIDFIEFIELERLITHQMKFLKDKYKNNLRSFSSSKAAQTNNYKMINKYFKNEHELCCLLTDQSKCTQAEKKIINIMQDTLRLKTKLYEIQI
ncbi:hypothetical protein COBT_002287, partial [Conglomerata obtusa]